MYLYICHHNCVWDFVHYLLQFDFQSQMLSSIQHGNRTKKVEFTDITGFQSEVRCPHGRGGLKYAPS